MPKVVIVLIAAPKQKIKPKLVRRLFPAGGHRRGRGRTSKVMTQQAKVKGHFQLVANGFLELDSWREVRDVGAAPNSDALPASLPRLS